MKKIATVASILLALVVSTPIVGASGGGYPAPLDTSYGGRAYGVGVLAPLGDTYYADTGNLPTSGGALFADFTVVNTDVANAVALLSYTRGFSDLGITEPATADVGLLGGTPYEIGATLVYARSVASCGGVSGTSEIFDLTIGGIPFGTSGNPNEVVYSIPGVITVIANEQNDQSFGTTHALTVNALDVWTPTVQIIVSSAYSAVTCAVGGGGILSGGSPSTGAGVVGTRGSANALGGGGMRVLHVPPADFMTGGGFFFSNPALSTCANSHVNFGFNAGPRPGQPTVVKGHLNVIDHDCNHHLEGTDVTDYFRYSTTTPDPQDVCRIWAGPAKWDGVSGYHFDAVTCDYGEPGRYDRFHAEVRPGNPPNYAQGAIYVTDNKRDNCPGDKPNCGDLTGGNIQLHRFG